MTTGNADSTWDVLLLVRSHPRAVGYNVPTGELWSYVATCLEDGACALTRSDLPPDTFVHRMSELYDKKEGIDVNGKPYTRRSKRFKWQLSVSDMDKLNALNARWFTHPKKKSKADTRADARSVQTCANGDDLCACLVLGSRCRTEVA